jgi:UDP-3-O-acyl-N-acetylglucosamine deacetylase
LSDFARPHAGPQVIDLTVTPDQYAKEIGSARTFGFKEEIDALLARGLALGGSLDNALIISDDGPSCPLRYENELVRHKALDLIGDLMLCGRTLKGHFVGFKSSHRLNVKMVKQLLAFAEDRESSVVELT